MRSGNFSCSLALRCMRQMPFGCGITTALCGGVQGVPKVGVGAAAVTNDVFGRLELEFDEEVDLER